MPANKNNLQFFIFGDHLGESDGKFREFTDVNFSSNIRG